MGDQDDSQTYVANLRDGALRSGGYALMNGEQD